MSSPNDSDMELPSEKVLMLKQLSSRKQQQNSAKGSQHSFQPNLQQRIVFDQGQFQDDRLIDANVKKGQTARQNDQVKKQTTTSSRRAPQPQDSVYGQNQQLISDQEISFQMLIPDKVPERKPSRERSQKKHRGVLKPAHHYKKKTVEENPFLPPNSSKQNNNQLMFSPEASRAQSNIQERPDVSQVFAPQMRMSPSKQSKSATRESQPSSRKADEQPYLGAPRESPSMRQRSQPQPPSYGQSRTMPSTQQQYATYQDPRLTASREPFILSQHKQIESVSPKRQMTTQEQAQMLAQTQQRSQQQPVSRTSQNLRPSNFTQKTQSPSYGQDPGNNKFGFSGPFQQSWGKPQSQSSYLAGTSKFSQQSMGARNAQIEALERARISGQASTSPVRVGYGPQGQRKSQIVDSRNQYLEEQKELPQIKQSRLTYDPSPTRQRQSLNPGSRSIPSQGHQSNPSTQQIRVSDAIGRDVEFMPEAEQTLERRDIHTMEHMLMEQVLAKNDLSSDIESP